MSDARGETRCGWASSVPEFLDYHDREWGFPVADDRRLFEKLTLESFQAGLSWRTILNKRAAFRAAFAGFDFVRIATFGDEDRERLLADASIVRHRGKIDAALNNARRAVEIAEEFGSLAAFLWRFEPDPATRPRRLTERRLRTMTTSPESAALAKALKGRGWAFFGPTTAYAFMQAMGLVNDHVHDCCVRDEVERARGAFRRPRQTDST